MNQYCAAFLSFLAAVLSPTTALASPPSPFIFQGTYAKSLVPYLNLLDHVYVLSGTADPTSVAQNAPKGSLYMRYGASGGQVYVKGDDGLSTTWTVGTPSTSTVLGPAGATDNACARFDGTTGYLIQNSSCSISDAGLLTTPNVIVSGLTATTVPYLDASKQLTSSAVTPTELGRVSGVTSALCGINQSCTETNKTLTSPSITTPTGIVKGDVGLGNVDNTSDATKNAASVTLTNKTIDTATNTITGLANSSIASGAAIAYSKLALSNSIVNADVASTAAVAYSKLALSNSIVNADVASTAAVAYSKLALTGSIVNADVASTAAVAYSKLALSNSIVNADVASTAAIAYSKLALGTSIVNADVATAAAIARSKIAAGSNNHVIIDDGSGNLSSEANLAISRGGTNAATAAAGFNNLSPMSALGDTIYGGASGAGTALAGNTTSTKKFLTQTGTGSVSAAPAWGTLAAGDLPGAAVQTKNTSTVDIEYVVVTPSCSSGTCTMNSNSAGIASVGWNSTGNYTVTFTGSPFSTTPACTTTTMSGAQNACNITATNTSTLTVVCYNTSSGNPGNSNFMITCMGAR